MKGEAVTIEKIEKRFTGAPVVRDVSIAVQAGEFLSLLGPSGSGKTTLLMMIAGFEMPDRGRISVGVRDITFEAPNRRDVGMVFQRYALFPHLTVAQNIAFPLRMRRLARSEIRTRVTTMLSMVQLDGLSERFPQQLSGGQQQRVAVARALIGEPPVLLMDEPLSALDKKLREALQLEIKQIQKRVGVTVIYVTHDQEEALTMSDRVAVMAEGELLQIGAPIDLYQQPANAFVAGFIGKMNFMTGTYLGQEGEMAVVRLSETATIRCPAPVAPVAAGDPLTLAIRPEHLGLRLRDRSRASSFPGRVEAVLFIGTAHVILVALEGRADEMLEVRLAANIALNPFCVGELVEVIAEPQAIRLFGRDGRELR